MVMQQLPKILNCVSDRIGRSISLYNNDGHRWQRIGRFSGADRGAWGPAPARNKEKRYKKREKEKEMIFMQQTQYNAPNLMCVFQL